MQEHALIANFASAPLVHEFVDALPFAVSWSSMPGGQILYCNAAFKALFGCSAGHFRRVDAFIDETYIRESQRARARERWMDFTSPPGATGITTISDMEIDILTSDGQIRTVLHCGLFLHEQGIGVAIFKDISDIKRSHLVLRKYAFNDPLTGIANRRALQERWQEETEAISPRRLAFLMVDLDGFKPVNDAHGHDAGDEALRIIATRLKNVVRGDDLVCRLGGDEFGILMAASGDYQDMEAVCERLVTVVAEPMEVAGSTVHVTASVGGCFYPDQAGDNRELFQRADWALYHVKQSGKGGWCWWDPSLRTASREIHTV